ncbi:hypothetical protein LA59_05645 [Vibrio harveyi]|uniref:hypothetical protein n=1 Tax=Vibrio harveyi group TaxID=717610 RepID=UPI0005395937|nr:MULTISPECIES: hypothetical protein [Vibrio harveyi group]AIV04973.1 hypothetical protein LA59_05645 [Vibrio harveyi]ANQ25870.1 hypothetical protein BA894_05170 [Vibrio natriegens]
MKLSEQDISRVIKLLKMSDSFSVSRLATELGVSRTLLYGKYRHLMPNRSTNTEEKIKQAILTLQAKTGRQSFTISEVAKAAGITRQCISRDYKYLLPFIRGEAALDIAASDTTLLTQEIKLLEDKITNLENEKIKEQKQFKQTVYSDMMKMDALAFEAHEDRATLTRLQNQIDEMTKANIELISELAEVRSQLSKQKEKLVYSYQNSQILCHVTPDYSAISDSINESAMMKIFLSAEDLALKKAIDICNSSKPDSIIFFQPFFSCELKSLEIVLPQGKLVIIESNHPQAKHFQYLLEKVINIPILTISAKGHTLQLAQSFCRKSYPKKFTDAFIARLYELLSYPELEDGFLSVTTINPPPLLSRVK